MLDFNYKMSFNHTYWQRDFGLKLIYVVNICPILFVCCSIFILLSRESDGEAMFWTNPHPLRSCPFQSFPVVSLTSYHLICCLFEAIKQG